jgi:hypothetical protein
LEMGLGRTKPSKIGSPWAETALGQSWEIVGS